MTGEAICELLKPLIGRSGSIFLAGKGFGQIALAVTDNKAGRGGSAPRRNGPPGARDRMDSA
jgi:hypothetical protein